MMEVAAEAVDVALGAVATEQSSERPAVATVNAERNQWIVT